MERQWGRIAIIVLVLGAISGIGAFIGSRALEAGVEVPEQAQPDEQAQEAPSGIDAVIASMPLEQKVAQLFVITPEAITGVGLQSAAGDATREAMQEHPVGGFIFFSDNLYDPTQVKEMLTNMQSYSKEICGQPIFLAIDEEGGQVSRIGGKEGFGVDNVGNASDIGATGDASAALTAARTIGSYLTELGFNANFAPVADIANNPESATMALRSFGSEEGVVTEMVRAEVEGFLSTGVLPCAKHFPGIGGAVGDSETGSIYSDKSFEDMAVEELKPFRAAMQSGVPMIMVGHIVCSGAGDTLPASVSSSVVTGVLRERLGYDGIVITDALNMGAIADVAPSSELGVMALKAGCDMILMPGDFEACYQGVLDAVKSGDIPESRIDESLARILDAKQGL